MKFGFDVRFFVIPYFSILVLKAFLNKFRLFREKFNNMIDLTFM